MRQRQPLRELARRFIGRLAVEGHHRGGNAGPPAKLRAPPVTDERHLDLVRAPANDFFVSMNRHVLFLCEGELRAGDEFYALRAIKQAKRIAKAPAPPHRARSTRLIRAEKNFR